MRVQSAKFWIHLKKIFFLCFAASLKRARDLKSQVLKHRKKESDEVKKNRRTVAISPVGAFSSQKKCNALCHCFYDFVYLFV